MGNAVPRHRLIARTGLPLLAFCALAGGLSRVPVRADSATTFVIPANDGYGLGECLTGGKPCGRIVADAWCEAHGRGSARAFGRAEDITASIANASTRDAAAPGSIIVSCGE
ncbi:MAG: hypothetical protein QOH65_2255 [Methylobacteriaceae bacterium]|jgi:hypothetical protein|nr:hypothetical protein [Methylobacteriaceae bacterium]